MVHIYNSGITLRCRVQTTIICSHILDDDDKLLKDYEIQAWAKELSHPADQQGCGIQVSGLSTK